LQAAAAYIKDDTVLRVVAYASIVLVTLVAARLAASGVRQVLGALQLGWIDRAAGAAVWSAAALVLLGTLFHLLLALDSSEIQASFDQSVLAGSMTTVSLVYTGYPWCAEVRHGSKEPVPVDHPEAVGCIELQQFTEGLLGAGLSYKLNDFLGYDAEPLANVVGASLSGSPDDLKDLVQRNR
jgi:hypothetical protein